MKLVPADSYSLLLRLVPADSIVLFLPIVLIAADSYCLLSVGLESLLDLFLEEISFISSHVFL